MFGEPSTPKGIASSSSSSRPDSWQQQRPTQPYMATTTPTTSSLPIVDPSLLSSPQTTAIIGTPAKGSNTSGNDDTGHKQHHYPTPSGIVTRSQLRNAEQAIALAQQSYSSSSLSIGHPSRPTLYATSSTTDLSPVLSPSVDRDELRTPQIEHYPPPFPSAHYSHPHSLATPAGSEAQRYLPHSHSHSHHQLIASPTQASPHAMPYPTTPTPQHAFGISGSLIVSEPQIIHASEEAGCTPVLPAQSDVFMTLPSNKGRPVLRPTLSHNGTYMTQTPNTWPRRMIPSVSESNERTRPATTDTLNTPVGGVGNVASLLTASAPVGTTYAAPPPPHTQLAPLERSYNSAQPGHANSRVAVLADQSFQGREHEAHAHVGHAPDPASASQHQQHASSTSFSASLPSLPPLHTNITSYAAPPPPPPAFATLHPTSHTASATPIANTTVVAAPPSHTYSDDIALQSTDPSPYETAPSSYPHPHPHSHSLSPWPAHSSLPSHSELQRGLSHPGYSYPPHNLWAPAVPTKMDEPILAPGELPVPRPPISYAALIGEALLAAEPPHQLYVSEISDSIKRRYTYYRQNPSKVYNGVRHQTSMCKAFVKLPRPYGDQTGGARKWAIRAGCEGWFHSSGYHPPTGSSSGSPAMSHSGLKKANSVGPAMGKAKSTARAKQLAIGTGGNMGMTSPEMMRVKRQEHEPYSPSSGLGGPSVGAAYDGTGRAAYTPMAVPTPISSSSSAHAHAHSSRQLAYSYPGGVHLPPPHGSHYLPPGYHYVPMQSSHHAHPSYAHAHAGQPTYVPFHPSYASYAYQQPGHPHPNAQSPVQQYMATPISAQAGHPLPATHDSPEWRYEGEIKTEQYHHEHQQHQPQHQQQQHHHHHHQQLQSSVREDTNQHSSPESTSSHHSHAHSAMHASPHAV